MREFVFTVVIIAVAAAGGFFIGQQSKSAASSESAIISDNKKPDLVKFIQSENILSLTSWETDDGKMQFGITRKLNEPCDKDSILKSCQQFSIYDESTKVAYELKDFSLKFVGHNRFKPKSSQLMIEQNGGGTDDSLTILDYKDGKYIELPVSSETQLRGGYWTMPEYRTGADAPYFKPSQLIVIQQGGGSDPNPSAAVFRYRDNKFQQVGEFQMQALGDFIETQLNNKAK